RRHRAGLPGRPAAAARPRVVRARDRAQARAAADRDRASRSARVGQAHCPRPPRRRPRLHHPLGGRPGAGDRRDPRPDRDRATRRRTARRRRARGGRQRSREDRRRRAAPRHGPDGGRTGARLRPALGRARLDLRPRCAQHRRRRDGRPGHGPRSRTARRDRRRRGRCRGSRRARGAGATDRGADLGGTARRGGRGEPRLHRGGGETRLHAALSVSDDVLSRALGDPEPEDHRPRPRGRRPLRAGAAPGVTRLFRNAYVVVMDDAGTEHEDGWVLVDDGVVAATGGGVEPEADERVDLRGALVTPGLVNTHHHLYQTLTRARAQESNLFGWLKALYPIWARLDEEAEHVAARTGLAELALSGCTTVFDHHYVFPRGAGDLIEAEMTAARELGVRLVPSRGSMDLGESDGGLPPDSLVED